MRTSNIIRYGMAESEMRKWGKVLTTLRINCHPRYLDEFNRNLQYTILSEVSSDPKRLPDRKRWEQWFMWHLEGKGK